MLEVLLAAALLFVLGWCRRRWLGRRELGWMPPELQGATLVYAERLFRAPGRIEITAKVDRVYRRGDGRLVLVELKTRRANRVYLSDVIELSAQRVAIMGQAGEDVAARAYVVVQQESGRRTAQVVSLLDRMEVDALVERRAAILRGTISPRLTCAPTLCQRCGFERECSSNRSSSRADARPGTRTAVLSGMRTREELHKDARGSDITHKHMSR